MKGLSVLSGTAALPALSVAGASAGSHSIYGGNMARSTSAPLNLNIFRIHIPLTIK